METTKSYPLDSVTEHQNASRSRRSEHRPEPPEGDRDVFDGSSVHDGVRVVSACLFSDERLARAHVDVPRFLARHPNSSSVPKLSIQTQIVTFDKPGSGIIAARVADIIVDGRESIARVRQEGKEAIVEFDADFSSDHTIITQKDFNRVVQDAAGDIKE